MFQLQSNASNFKQAMVNGTEKEQENNRKNGEDNDDNDHEDHAPSSSVESATGSHIEWNELDVPVFEMDLEVSRQHVNAFRHHVDRQLEERQLLRSHYQKFISYAVISNEEYPLKDNAGRMQKELEDLRALHGLCVEALEIQTNRGMPQSHRSSAPPLQPHPKMMQRRHSETTSHDANAKRMRVTPSSKMERNASDSCLNGSSLENSRAGHRRWDKAPSPPRETPPTHASQHHHDLNPSVVPAVASHDYPSIAPSTTVAGYHDHNYHDSYVKREPNTGLNPYGSYHSHSHPTGTSSSSSSSMQYHFVKTELHPPPPYNQFGPPPPAPSLTYPPPNVHHGSSSSGRGGHGYIQSPAPIPVYNNQHGPLYSNPHYSPRMDMSNGNRGRGRGAYHSRQGRRW
jgi:hypothetical protein